MNVDAAGTLAEVDAALIVAIVVEAKFRPASDSDERREWVVAPYFYGLLAVVLSLALAVMSISHNKALGNNASLVALCGTFYGVFSLMGDPASLAPQIRKMSRKQRRRSAAIILSILVWFAIWAIGFIPNWWFPWSLLRPFD